MPNTSLNEEDLLVAGQRGDDCAFRELHERFRRPLLKLARKWAPHLDPRLSEDIVQVTLAKVASQSVPFDPAEQRAFAYVAGFVPNAAQRVAAQHKQPGERSRERRRTIDNFEDLAAEWRWGPAPSDDIGDHEDIAAPSDIERVEARIDIERAAAKAEPKVARAIALVLEHNVSFNAAAKAVGLPASTLSRRLSALGRAA